MWGFKESVCVCVHLCRWHLYICVCKCTSGKWDSSSQWVMTIWIIRKYFYSGRRLCPYPCQLREHNRHIPSHSGQPSWLTVLSISRSFSALSLTQLSSVIWWVYKWVWLFYIRPLVLNLKLQSFHWWDIFVGHQDILDPQWFYQHGKCLKDYFVWGSKFIVDFGNLFCSYCSGAFDHIIYIIS